MPSRTCSALINEFKVQYLDSLGGSPHSHLPVIGTVRHECLDRMLIFGEAHLRRILSLYAIYYNESRTHLSLHKDAPLHRAIQRSGTVVAVPVLGGLHHRYARI